ncbi:MAG: hypothetical protein FJZ01_13460 [Candidatus Sericytochromatia bacterium]|nr:hypothetical protein [Candidatus Tanganyikabacteria bacterium]
MTGLATDEFRAQVTFTRAWWSVISSTRIFVEAFCSHVAAEGDLSERVSMVCHELLQNAWQHATAEESLIGCSVIVADRCVKVSVDNAATNAAAEDLAREIAAVGGGDPLDVFVQKMKSSLAPGQAGNLGLARIRYEGRASLELVPGSGRVTVVATLER